jgi:hypothetical protein
MYILNQDGGVQCDFLSVPSCVAEKWEKSDALRIFCNPDIAGCKLDTAPCKFVTI